MVSYMINHFQRFKRFQWLNDLLPLLDRTIQQISQSQADEMNFSLFKDLLQFLLTDLVNNKNKVSLYVPAGMSVVGLEFDEKKDPLEASYEWSRKCLNVDYSLNVLSPMN